MKQFLSSVFAVSLLVAVVCASQYSGAELDKTFDTIVKTKDCIGFIGAGNIGGTVARLATEKGFKVVLSNRRGPESLSQIVKDLGALASAGTVEDATKCGIVVLSIPMGGYKTVPAQLLKGKILIDTNNYYPGRDGRFPELDNGSTTSSELLAVHVPGAKIVKAFNTIWYVHLGSHGSSRGDVARRALPIAGDGEDAKLQVAALIDAFGFDVVDIGPLKEGRHIQPNTPVYNTRLTAEETIAKLEQGPKADL